MLPEIILTERAFLAGLPSDIFFLFYLHAICVCSDLNAYVQVGLSEKKISLTLTHQCLRVYVNYCIRFVNISYFRVILHSTALDTRRYMVLPLGFL